MGWIHRVENRAQLGIARRPLHPIERLQIVPDYPFVVRFGKLQRLV
jgi:hypothetical protein